MIDVELDICPAYGWQAMPEFNTLIKQTRDGRETRRALWGMVKHRYALPFQNITDDAYLMHLKSLFLAARGMEESFLAKDFSDYRAENAVFGVGDGAETEFDLLLPYTFGVAGYSRRIMYPVDPVFRAGGVPVAATFDPVTKRVVFDVAPDPAAILTWSGEFRVPVRFASDAFAMTIDNRSGDNYVMNGSVELLEVWE